MTISETPLHIIDMEKGKDGTFNRLGKISSVIKQPTISDEVNNERDIKNSDRHYTTCNYTTSNYTDGNSSVAEKLRTANEKYMDEMRRDFDKSRREMMGKMSTWTNYSNVD